MSNDAAKTLRALHVPQSPLILANVWDVASLQAILALNHDAADQPVKAVATASWAIAAAAGVRDEHLTWELNRDAIARIAPLCRDAGLPLSADLQDGYGYRIDEVVRAAVEAGVVGANIEDSIPQAGFAKGIAGSLYPLDEQVRRLRGAVSAADAAGCRDFVLNARCDVFCLDDTDDDGSRLAEAIARGKAFLEAGAATVFYWGGPRRRMSKTHVQRLVRELDDRVAVQLAAYPGEPTVAELAELGVARISVGPALYRIATEAVQKAARSIYCRGKLPAQ
ncbi:phosphoenolpyruvate phosphomutase domain-containing protein [Hirsutella rhossiliensis]|uniref:Phosphoenolpyruvate phosphomutase domain-containing protein n=1 Tax=Hirsutella rhossiliensis TaxID=111463 RepID=A0A9P8N966_9HYPO|nr:phosphoenolpyruvate phosphomutase domain-containing protein [Hirsutella rhossiliensis]KAH0968039.1 phosphoenolpyruvate phosphomutase domain-containing protein [Hirsutella rhossiliensis]